MTRRTFGNHRKAGAASRQHLLELNVRTASIQRQRRRKVEGVLWKSLAFVILLSLLVAGVFLGAQKFFFQNAEYSLHHLDLKLDGVMTREGLVSLTGFEEGKNLFLLDLDEANKKLCALPEVRSGSVSIERLLPDTIKVSLERRTPVFLIAGSGDTGDSFIPGKSFLCDSECVLMQPARLDPEFLNLPILRGLNLGNAEPGNHLDDARLSFALTLLNSLSELPTGLFKIRSVDVSKGYAAVVTDESKARFTFGTAELSDQIERLKKLLSHCQQTGRQIETANLMLVRNTPVTFVLTPEEASSKITPVATPKKSVHQSTHH